MDLLTFLITISIIYTLFYLVVLYLVVKGASKQYQPNGNDLIDQIPEEYQDMYRKGQEDLIETIKEKVLKLEEETNGKDIMFDVLHLLKSIEPTDGK
jgi:nitrogen fixation-related uncharacterized protein